MDEPWTLDLTTLGTGLSPAITLSASTTQEQVHGALALMALVILVPAGATGHPPAGTRIERERVRM